MISEALKKKIIMYDKSQVADLNQVEKRELKAFCQETFKYSVDIWCGDCVCKYLKKTGVYLKIITI